MLQRPQSVCLLAIVTTMIAMALLPIWVKSDTATVHFYVMNAWCFRKIGSEGKLLNVVYFPYALVGILALTSAGIAAYEVFKYDNRATQLKLGLLNALVLIATVGLLLYMIIQQEKHLLPEVSGKYKLGFLLPAIALASNLLANRFIQKDEKLVRSTNRMR